MTDFENTQDATYDMVYGIIKNSLIIDLMGKKGNVNYVAFIGLRAYELVNSSSIGIMKNWTLNLMQTEHGEEVCLKMLRIKILYFFASIYYYKNILMRMSCFKLI